MNRRDVLKNVAMTPLAAGVAVVSTPAEAKPKEPDFLNWKVEKFIELPLRPGDEITGLTTYRDEIFATSRYGEVYRLSQFR